VGGGSREGCCWRKLDSQPDSCSDSEWLVLIGVTFCLMWHLDCDYYFGLYIGQFKSITDLSCWQKHVSLYHVLGPMFHAILWRQITTFSVSVMELYGTLRLGEKFRNFMVLFNVSYGTEQRWVKWSWNEYQINQPIKMFQSGLSNKQLLQGLGCMLYVWQQRKTTGVGRWVNLGVCWNWLLNTVCVCVAKIECR